MKPSQAYFWTKAWQQGEREADADIASGRTWRFEDVEAAIAWLVMAEVGDERP